jgi:hypothetical protein
MVVAANPFCPISFGFLGFLGAVVSQRTSLINHGRTTGGEGDLGEDEEREDLLDQNEGDCDELSEDRIANFLESQKEEYYKSIGMVVPKQMKVNDTATTPGDSIIEFSSSRETSYVDDGEESALLSMSRESTPEPLVYSISESDDPTMAEERDTDPLPRQPETHDVLE